MLKTLPESPCLTKAMIQILQVLVRAEIKVRGNQGIQFTLPHRGTSHCWVNLEESKYFSALKLDA